MTKKPILLFLHGFPDGPDIWSYQREYFAERFEVLTPEIKDYGSNRFALHMLRFLRDAGVTRDRAIYCIGHDLGAAYAWNLAPFLGTRLKGLVILNGMSPVQMAKRWKLPQQWLKSWYIYFMQVPGLAETVSQLAPKQCLQLAYRFGGLKKMPPVDTQIARRRLVKPVQQYREFLKEIPAFALRRVPRLRCPVLVLWGEKDPFLVPPTLDELEPYAAEVTVRILEGNHWVYRESPEVVNGLLDEFFDPSKRATQHLPGQKQVS